MDFGQVMIGVGAPVMVGVKAPGAFPYLVKIASGFPNRVNTPYEDGLNMGLWIPKMRFRVGTAQIVASLAFLAFVAVSPIKISAQEKLQPIQSGGQAATVDATEPVLVVTLGSINKLMEDVNYITSVIGQPQAGGMFTMLAGTFTQGVDLTKPIGILVPLVNGTPQPIAVVPTDDVKAILSRLEAQTGPADELDDGTLVIAVGANTIYIRQLGNWAAMAPSKDLLDLAPADPTDLFVGMGNDYDIAFRLRLQQVPDETRGMLTAQIRQGFEQAMERQDGDAEASREMAEGTIKQLETFINETDVLEFGLNIDQNAKHIAIDTLFTAVPGTKLATMYSGQQAIPSQFASVIRDDAAGYYHAAMSISPEAVEQTTTSLKSGLNSLHKAIENKDDLSAEQQEDMKALLDRLSELAIKSIQEGRADIGALLLADQNDFRFVFGAFVADGNEAAQIVKDLADKVKDEPDAPRFEFDKSTYKGVTMHLIEADVPADEDEARRVFGEKLSVHIGTGPKALYAAVGKDSDVLLKELIDKGGNDAGGNRPIGQMRLTLMPILQFAQSVEANEVISSMIDALARSADAGRLSMVQDGVENGQKSKVLIGEGLLQAVGAAIRQAQQAKMGAQF